MWWGEVLCVLFFFSSLQFDLLVAAAVFYRVKDSYLRKWLTLVLYLLPHVWLWKLWAHTLRGLLGRFLPVLEIGGEQKPSADTWQCKAPGNGRQQMSCSFLKFRLSLSSALRFRMLLQSDGLVRNFLQPGSAMTLEAIAGLLRLKATVLSAEKLGTSRLWLWWAATRISAASCNCPCNSKVCV